MPALGDRAPSQGLCPGRLRFAMYSPPPPYLSILSPRLPVMHSESPGPTPGPAEHGAVPETYRLIYKCPGDRQRVTTGTGV